MKITPAGIAVIETDTRHISKWVEDQGRLDIQEAQIKPWLKNVPENEQGVCIDVGAFIGDTALTMSKHVGPAGFVLAIEPNPEAFACLKYNAAHNDWLCLNTHPVNVAIGPVPGEPTTLMKDTNAGASWLSRHGSGGLFTQPLDTVYDNFAHPGEQVHFIKIDVEGWEVEVLNSAVGILTRDKPDLLIEINHGALARQGYCMADVVAILKRYGYRIQITDPSLTQDSPQFDIYCTTK